MKNTSYYLRKQNGENYWNVVQFKFVDEKSTMEVIEGCEAVQPDGERVTDVFGGETLTLEAARAKWTAYIEDGYTRT